MTDVFKDSTTGQPTQRAMRGVAGDAAKFMAERAAEHTPKRSGRIAQKWRATEPRPTMSGAHGWEAQAENDDYRARFLEYGIEPHHIGPDDEQAVETPEGPRAGVDHPGHRAYGMLATAADETEAAIGAISEPHLRKWADEIESNAAKHRGITKT